MFAVWLCFYLLEILNPNNVQEAWNINLTPYALIPLICAFVVPLVIRTKKDIELSDCVVSVCSYFYYKRLLAEELRI